MLGVKEGQDLLVNLIGLDYYNLSPKPRTAFYSPLFSCMSSPDINGDARQSDCCGGDKNGQVLEIWAIIGSLPLR